MKLEITRKSDLAVRALQQLAARPMSWKAGELAATIATTPGFLGQVISPLIRMGWVESAFGPTGGYRYRAPATEPTLLDVIEAVEGSTRDHRCVLRHATACAGQAGGPECALHEGWLGAREALIEVLGATSALGPCRAARTAGGPAR